MKKSHATMAEAWACRNSDQLGPVLRGAGPRPERRRTSRIVIAETSWPSCLRLALDAPIAPARIVRGEADDQILDALRDRGSAATPTPPHRRFARLEKVVPAQQGLGTHNEDFPSGPGEQPAGGGE